MTTFVANAPALLILSAAVWSELADPLLYDRLVREDGIVEWATFYAFVVAALCYGARARTTWLGTGFGHAWLSVGLAAFCALVAMEEISWGQRLLGYQPPDYFLEHNFQQELNLHNIVGSDLRQAVFLIVVIGFGGVLPIAIRVGAIARLAERLRIGAPPIEMTPSFIVTGAFYVAYPWSHSGEWAELLLGMAMALAARFPRPTGAATEWPRAAGRIVSTVGIVAALGAATTGFALLRAGDPEQIEAAERELAALRVDFSAARTRTRCGLHKRVYTHVVENAQDHLQRGAFASLSGSGVDPSRARFFLDPWGTPYWIQHECADDRSERAIFVYSFGPNRLRDSTDWAVLPDDLGVWIIRPQHRGE